MLKEIIKNWQAKEKRWLVAVSLVLIVLTTLPYFYLYLKTPFGYVYDWASYINAGDNFVYYSYINQASEGAWLLDNLYTSEQTMATLRPFWVILGKASAWFNFSVFFSYHFFRLLLIPLLVLISYLFISYFVKLVNQRIMASALFLLASGQGWFYILVKPFFWVGGKSSDIPFDFIMAASFPFSAMFVSPHFIAAWIFLLLTLVFGFWSLQRRNFFYYLLAGLSGCYLILFQPFFIPTVFILLGGWWVYRCWQVKTIFWYGTGQLILAGMIMSPAVFYYFFLYFYDWTTTIKTVQNTLNSPNLLISMTTFGLTWLLAVAGYLIWRRQDKDNPDQRWLLWWAIVFWVLIYLPFLWQQRLVSGWWFALAILTSYFFIWINRVLRQKFKHWQIKQHFLWVPVGLILVLSNLNVLMTNIFYKQHGFDFLFYYPQSLEQAAVWLEKNTEPSAVFLSNNEGTLMALPGFINRKVFIGHLVETVYVKSKINLLTWFFGSNNQDDSKVSFLRYKDIDYIIFNEGERIFGNKFKPDEKEYLTLVYETGGYYVYKVNLK